MSTSAERKAKNEGTFRAANEHLSEGARDLLGGDDAEPVPFICECPTPECTEIVLLTLPEYEYVRARGERGLAALGHDHADVERIVEQNDRFVVTEKFGLAGEVHDEADPRG